MVPNPLKKLPSVSELLELPPIKSLTQRLHKNTVVVGVRDYLGRLAADLHRTAGEIKLPDPMELAERLRRWILQQPYAQLRAVVNATGEVFSPRLGRAPLAEEALREAIDTGRDYCFFGIDPPHARQVDPNDSALRLLCELTGAEAALAVNTSASALWLALAVECRNRELVVSRGQVFRHHDVRLIDLAEQAGVALHDVGTTDLTTLDDYRQALGERTGAVLLARSETLSLTGSEQAAPARELIAAVHQAGARVIDFLPFGSIVEPATLGLAIDGHLAAHVAAGADMVICDGDRLIGGPQCGLIVGKKTAIELLQKHPLLEAMRVDKLTAAALLATLRLYRDPAVANEQIPVLALLTTSRENLQFRAERLARQLAAAPAVGRAESVEIDSPVLGPPESLPRMPGWGIALAPADGRIEALVERLGSAAVPILGRAEPENGRVLLDLRSVPPRQDRLIADGLLEENGLPEQQGGEPPTDFVL